MKKIEAFRNKIESKVPEKLKKFFYSDIYIAIIIASVFLSWVIDFPAIALAVISISISIILIISRDILPSLPAAVSAGCMFAVDDFGKYLMLIPILIPLILSVIFHIIVYPPKFRLGKMIIPQCLVIIALLLGGVTCISSEDYLSALGYSLVLGILLLVVYILYDAYYSENKYIEPRIYLARVLMYLGILLAVEILAFYLKNHLGFNDWTSERWLNLGWGIDNNVATILLLTAPMTFYLVIAKSEFKDNEMHMKRFSWLYVTIGLLQYVTIVFTFSRGAILASIITAPVVLIVTLVKAKNKLQSAIPIIIAIIGIVIFYAVFHEKINEILKSMTANIIDGENKSGWASRDQLYKEAWNCFLAHPVFGAGMGYKGQFYEPGEMGLYFFHSTLFQILGALGLVGLVAYGIHYSVRYWIIFKKIKTSIFSLFVLLAFIGFEGYAMIDTGVFVPYPIMTIVIILTLFVERNNMVDNELI